jgi:predicted nucleic acid-binding protein
MVDGDRTKILFDTNILLRAIQLDSPFCVPARKAIKRYHRVGLDLCVTPQNVKEFWNACTRPTDKNGLGLSIAGTERNTQLLEKYFVVLPDSAAAYGIWRQLVSTYEVIGTKVHDAYLVATMKAHGITEIITFNTADFTRYSDIQAVDPRSL